MVFSATDACHAASSGWRSRTICVSLNTNPQVRFSRSKHGVVPLSHIATDDCAHETLTRASHQVVQPPRKHCNGVIWRQPAHSPWHLSIATFAQVRDWEDDHSCDEAFVSTTQVCVSRWLASGQDCLIIFTRILGFRGQGVCQRSFLHNVLYQIPSVHLQDLFNHSTTKFHKVTV